MCDHHRCQSQRCVKKTNAFHLRYEHILNAKLTLAPSARVANHPFKNRIVSYSDPKVRAPCWAYTLSRTIMKIENSVLNVEWMNTDRVLFINMYSKPILRLSILVTYKLTEHSHTSMTIRNPAHLPSQHTVACHEDNGGQHSSMYNSDTDSYTLLAAKRRRLLQEKS